MAETALNEELLSHVKADLIEKSVAELLDSAWELHGERTQVVRRTVAFSLLAGAVALGMFLISSTQLWLLPLVAGIVIALQGVQRHAEEGGRLIAIAKLENALRKDGLELRSKGDERTVEFSYTARAELHRVQRIIKAVSEA